MLTREELTRRAARERTTPGSAVVRAERVSAEGDLVCDEEARGTVEGAERVVAFMEHVDEQGRSRLVSECDAPSTLRNVVQRVVTDLCVADVTSEGLVVREVAPGISAREVQEKSEPRLLAGPDLTVLEA